MTILGCKGMEVGRLGRLGSAMLLADPAGDPDFDDALILLLVFMERNARVSKNKMDLAMTTNVDKLVLK